MSKTKKPKTNKRNKKYYGQKTKTNIRNPRVFFKKTGIKPLIKPREERSSHHIKNGVLKRFGQTKVDEMESRLNSNREVSLFDFCHTNLELVKIWYGTDFNHLYQIASELARLSMPHKAAILDVGGGPGQIAFWIANIWDPAHITVADVYSNIGTEWAKQIGENRVTFIESTLPALKELQGKKYDIIVMSRVLSFINYLGLLDGIPDIKTEDYLESQEATILLDNLYDISFRIKEYMKPNGRIIVIESWSDARILLIGKAFERAGLYINLDLFEPEKLSRDYSIIVFSADKESSIIDCIPNALSTGFHFPNESPEYRGFAAETIYRLFRNGNTKMILEYESIDGELKMYTEIIEKEGLVVLYRASNKGGRGACLFPGIAIPILISETNKLERDLVENNDGKILNKVLSDLSA
jgi:hypothetical protein